MIARQLLQGMASPILPTRSFSGIKVLSPCRHHNSVGHRRSFPSTKSSDSKNQLKAPDVSVSEYARGMKEYRREVQAAEDAILGPGEEVSWAEKFFAVFTVNTFALLMSFACIALDFRIRYQAEILPFVVLAFAAINSRFESVGSYLKLKNNVKRSIGPASQSKLELKDQINSVETTLTERINSLEEKIGGVEEKIRGMETTLTDRIIRLEEEISVKNSMLWVAIDLLKGQEKRGWS